MTHKINPMTFTLSIIYISAMLLANVLAASFGPVITPFNSFFLIGLDMTLRDYLQQKISFLHMGLLIAATAGLTFFLTPSASSIAIASAVAFSLSAVTSWFVFYLSRRMKWIARSSTANVFGSAVDSFVFPLFAFGAFLPHIVAGQLLAKVFGGFVWAVIFQKTILKNRS